MAASQAEVQADATASKLLRLRSGLDQDIRILVGYLSPPEGLNGESVLIEWLEQKTGAHTFDLMKQRADFHATADRWSPRPTARNLCSHQAHGFSVRHR